MCLTVFVCLMATIVACYLKVIKQDHLPALLISHRMLSVCSLILTNSLKHERLKQAEFRIGDKINET